MSLRKAELRRETKETRIEIYINLDGRGEHDIGVEDPFLKHMLSTFSIFSGFDLKIKAAGDLQHHLLEDVGIALGESLNMALEREKVARFGYSIVPMDDALILTAVDLARRAYFETNMDGIYAHEFDFKLYLHFMRSLSYSMPMTLHVYRISGSDPHHLIEAAFKSLALSLKNATAPADRLLSLKGSL